MSLHGQLQARQAEGRPIRVGVIGAGKFGTMFLSQADLDPARARANMILAGWPEAASVPAAAGSPTTHWA